MSDELDALADSHLSTVFANEVAGRQIPKPKSATRMTVRERLAMESFTTSADAVLPFLEKSEIYPEIFRPWEGLTTDAVEAKRKWEVRVDGVGAIAPTFARAVCIALIRAKRAEKGKK